MCNKIYIIAFSFLVFCTNVFAQNRSKSVYLELMGPSDMIGVSYDARIMPDSKFGYRVGLAYASPYLLNIDDNQTFASMPLGLNYLAGNGNHRLEIGAGASPGVYHHSDRNKSEDKFGCIAFCTVGYRYTADNGIQLRCGVSPYVTFGNKYADKKVKPLYPYLSIGYAF